MPPSRATKRLHIRDVKVNARGHVVIMPRDKRARRPTKRDRRRAVLARLPVQPMPEPLLTLTFTNWRVLGPNRSEHPMARARRVNDEHERLLREFVRLGWRPVLPVVVTFYRHGKRRMDRDNMIAGLKSARDSVSDWLGVDDADPRITWRYFDGRTAGRDYELWIDVEPRGDSTALRKAKG